MEKWAVIPGYPKYQVSNLGNVLGPRGLRKHVLDKNGYPYFSISLSNGTCKNFWIHKLVCQMFNGPKPFESAQALHRNGIKTDVRAENLYWGSHQQNMDDMVRQGASSVGERHGKAVLTWDIIREIRKQHSEGISKIELARKFLVSPQNIGYIIRHKTWRE